MSIFENKADYISKPIDRAKLINRVQFWLGDAESVRGAATQEPSDPACEALAQEATDALEDLIDSVDDLDDESRDQKKARR